jgi:hypothetical protein
MATTAAAMVAKARRDVMSHFLSRNAVTPASAVPYVPDRRLRERMFERLKDAGVLKAGKSGYYVDVSVWDVYARKRRRRIGLAMAGGMVVAGALAAIFA